MTVIDKDALVAEIERRKDVEVDYDESGHNFASWADETHYFALDSIENFIDTLEVKEVDLELTLKDISMIRQIMFDYNRQIRNEMSIPNDEDYCKEVLKRFKAQKEEYYDTRRKRTTKGVSSKNN